MEDMLIEPYDIPGEANAEPPSHMMYCERNGANFSSMDCTVCINFGKDSKSYDGCMHCKYEKAHKYPPMSFRFSGTSIMAITFNGKQLHPKDVVNHKIALRSTKCWTE